MCLTKLKSPGVEKSYPGLTGFRAQRMLSGLCVSLSSLILLSTGLCFDLKLLMVPPWWQSLQTLLLSVSNTPGKCTCRCPEIHLPLPRNHTQNLRHPISSEGWATDPKLGSVGLSLAWVWVTYSVPGTRGRVSLFQNGLRRRKAGSFNWTLRYHSHFGAEMGNFHHQFPPQKK